jgi:mono/diheme cytochrome c family protein
MHPMFKAALALAAPWIAVGALSIAAAHAQTASAASMTRKGSITGPYAFPERGGAAIYKGVCQGCHMEGGQGATGAATYPALARNPKLREAAYPIAMVLNGHGAMPTFKDALDDEQIAEVVGYIRASFGNADTAKVTAAQVKALR